MHELVALFGNASLEVLPRVGHFPRVDDAVSFVTVVQDLLRHSPAAGA
jgi:hypothetical protein